MIIKINMEGLLRAVFMGAILFVGYWAYQDTESIIFMVIVQAFFLVMFLLMAEFMGIGDDE